MFRKIITTTIRPSFSKSRPIIQARGLSFQFSTLPAFTPLKRIERGRKNKIVEKKNKLQNLDLISSHSHSNWRAALSITSYLTDIAKLYQNNETENIDEIGQEAINKLHSQIQELSKKTEIDDVLNLLFVRKGQKNLKLILNHIPYSKKLEKIFDQIFDKFVFVQHPDYELFISFITRNQLTHHEYKQFSKILRYNFLIEISEYQYDMYKFDLSKHHTNFQFTAINELDYCYKMVLNYFKTFDTKEEIPLEIIKDLEFFSGKYFLKYLTSPSNLELTYESGIMEYKTFLYWVHDPKYSSFSEFLDSLTIGI